MQSIMQTMHQFKFTCLAFCLACLPSGCSLLSDASARLEQDVSASQAKSLPVSSSGGQVVNPPARTIRFDGHEIVLGQAEATELTPDKLQSLLTPLLSTQRYRTAASLIQLHRETSERLISERWATDYNEPSVQLVARVLSQRSTRPENSWLALLRIAQERPNLAKPYQQARNAFAAQLQTADPTNEQAAGLQQLAQNVNHPLVKIDCLRLLGLRELVAGRHAWAESLCRQLRILLMDPATSCWLQRSLC